MSTWQRTRICPDIGTTKTKTTRSRPAPVTSNLVNIPDKLLEVQKDVIISISSMTVNSLKFLTTISHELFYRTAQYVPTNVVSEYEKCMDQLMAVYKRGQFTITKVHCNNNFHKLMDESEHYLMFVSPIFAWFLFRC
jgi:hypothetical protein